MTRRRARRLPLLALGLALALPAASAAAAGPQPPLELPPAPAQGDASAAPPRAGVAAARPWIVAGKPGAATRRVAARHGARAVALGIHVVPRARARGFAAALRRAGLLAFAEPDRLARPRQAPSAPDPLDARARWRDAVVDPALAPPPVTPASPLLALVDSPVDLSHPEFAVGSGVSGLPGVPVTESHGTATAAIAAAPANDVGIRGVWPGMRALNVPLPAQRIACSDSARQISRAIDAGAAVINMSYGSQQLCFAEYVALQFATGRGIVTVAAAGNEFAEGNPLEFPASLPHVLTVGAVGSDLRSAAFSNENLSMDLAAPGVGILTAVRAGDAGDVDGDGYEAVTGTSFAAPMVAAAAAWVRAARPDLSGDQVAQVVRRSARDLQEPGRDAATGFGLLDVGAALRAAPPFSDPLEPNDDMVWIDGRAFEAPDAPVYRGRGSARVVALLDRYEDPADVYRVVVPARGGVRVRVRARRGNPDLNAYDRRARSTGSARYRIARSRRAGSATETATLANRGSRARTVYVEVLTRSLDADYELSLTRR